MPTALHLANLRSSNVGNGALILGTERVLREDWGGEWSFDRLAWDDFTFGQRAWDESFIDEANRADLLLVNGAVTFNGRGYLKNTGSRLDLPIELWKKITVPILCYGLSYRFWPGGTYENLDALKAWLREMEQVPHFVLGLRNDGTRAWLRELSGLPLTRAVEIVDPAMFVPADEAVTPAEPAKGYVILALNDEDAAQRYASSEQRSRMLRVLSDELVEVLRTRDLDLKLALHYFDDFRAAADFIDLLPPAFAHQRVSTFGPVRGLDAAFFYATYRSARAVVAMRVHSMSPALGLGCPTLPLTTQARMQRFLEDIGLGDAGLAADNIAALHRTFSKRLSGLLDRPGAQAAALNLAGLRQRVRKSNLALKETLGF